MAAHIEKIKSLDCTRYLVLYSGGSDSTLFISLNESAKYLLHFPSRNTTQTKIASHNAFLLNRYLNIGREGGEKNGELSEVHGLHDLGLLLEAGIYAISHGFDGIVACFNKDDIGCDFKAVESILQKYKPGFEIALPLLEMDQPAILNEVQKHDIKFVSCMIDLECGFCGKCKRNINIMKH